MIPQAFITQWRATAPWPDDAQVEQDLVLSRAVVELFSVPALGSTLALRGGAALNKLFLTAPARYSEDIDLVQTTSAPIGPTLDAIRAKLDPWLGDPKRSVSQMVALTYRFESEIAPIRPLRLKIEINTHEHFTVMGYDKKNLAIKSRWFTGAADITTYQLDELLGTKLRALYQRKKGRDLFDLWLCLAEGRVDPQAAVYCFQRYMEFEKHSITRSQFERNLREKADDPAFLGDIAPLLVPGVQYDAEAAIRRIEEMLIRRLDGER